MLFMRSLNLGSNIVSYKHFRKSFHNSTSSRFFSKFNQSFKSTLFSASAVVGITAYIIHKKKISCDADETESLDLIDLGKKDNSNFVQQVNKYEEAINKSRDILLRVKDEVGAPGIVVGVSVDGKTVWTEGFGYADVENRVLCTADTVMRIASISKSITMAAVAKLIEQGKLDLDKPIQEYVPSFPPKTFDGKPVIITCRRLLSHTSGIRHYEKNIGQNDNKNSKTNNEKNKREEKGEFDNKEYYIKERHDVKSSLNLFKDDPLIAKPGSKFHYSTHGYTLVSAIIESIAKEDFPSHMNKLFRTLGMKNTYFDENDNIIYNRSRNYKKNKHGHLINAPYVDNSYKWAGGGLLSSVTDLLQFANAMLYSYQFQNYDSYKKSLDKNYLSNVDEHSEENKKLCPGFLTSRIMETMWMPVINCKDHAKYALGWVVFPEKQECGFCEKVKFCVYHTGGAIGASSILLILPKSSSTNKDSALETDNPPKGIVVTILTNLMPINLTTAALKIAELFDR
ncbi:serine beta-lactamase-like protein LACTB, mitochondrial [Parasteatoda tepidariorum]|nr:serine beta-lactamase-like protein LACTB, mitochondrial [Parasteatoda tepidariorum]